MPFDIELSHYQTGETKELTIFGNNMDEAINLVKQEEPEFIIESIATSI
ncbi:hypothetical protein [Synechococcus phage S-N03]|uniref:Uncharacterized protein n=1 Tax=Synechococcus phage S-N03 TaxID=2718943 RepID=A0A6G8R5N0_9CAUD|nr:hypothetical protein PQC09_gp048 [Synechococcus phage S-N03]QIN96683.1 hypothetical protein [Synechococcus phage S-N03]